MKRLLLCALLPLVAVVEGFACTNFIVTKGASADGSVMVTDAADSHTRYGYLDYSVAADHKAGEMRRIIQWGSDSRGPFYYHGDIPQAPHTYNVVGNMNEFQLILGETTFNGRKVPVDTTAIIDYGSMMNICLQRCRTAREAIALFAEITDLYGYCQTGETLTIADKNEAWIMDIFPRTPHYDEAGVNTNKGVVWVAARIPDGYISAHANNARITKINFNDPDNWLWSKDVVDEARRNGWYEGTDEDFSFADTYCPMTSQGAMRSCDLRVWSFFNRFGEEDMSKYVDYVMAETPSNRLPLWVRPKAKISVQELAEAMRDHYEGTIWDMRKGIAAGPHGSPYRWRDTDWTVDGVKYANERPVAVQQTGFWFLAQARGWLPDEVGGLFWFAVDDAGTSPLTPIYACSTDISDHYRFGNGSLKEYSPTSMFWMVNRIAQLCYLHYNSAGDEVHGVASAHEAEMVARVAENDAAALEILKKSRKKAVKALTEFSVREADALFDKWEALDKYVLVKYMDGNIKKQNPDGSFESYPDRDWTTVSPLCKGLSESYKRAIVEERGDLMRVRKVNKKENTALWNGVLEQYASDSTVNQVLLVKCLEGYDAEAWFYVKDGGKWRLERRSDAQLGEKGLGKTVEGDMKTPEGDFGIRCAFGILPNPGTVIPYVYVTDSIYCCACDGPYYNQIIDTAVVHHGNCRGEHMIEIVPDYNYGMHIDYNHDNTVGLGNSIFLHGKGNLPYTFGCVAIDEDFVKEILLKSDKNIRIIIHRK